MSVRRCMTHVLNAKILMEFALQKRETLSIPSSSVTHTKLAKKSQSVTTKINLGLMKNWLVFCVS